MPPWFNLDKLCETFFSTSKVENLAANNARSLFLSLKASNYSGFKEIYTD